MAITFKGGKIEERPEFFVPAGNYKFEIIEAKEDTSTNGNDVIKLKCRVVNDDGTKGILFLETLTFTEKAFYRVDQFLKSVGKHPGEGEQIAIDCDDLIGLTGEARLKVEEYKGKRNNKVDYYLFEEDEF